ncbi:MAG: hypothetical protein IJR63_09975 [Synergistaceae bacterium]|nr:hypothetical protein [Synergistaceae bacterium]
MTQFTLGLSDLPEYRYECSDALEFSRTIPDESVKMVMTSPPYNIGKSYETRRDIQDYIADFEPLISELVRMLRVDGSVCWQVGNFVDDGEVFPLDVYFYPLFKSHGLKLRTASSGTSGTASTAHGDSADATRSYCGSRSPTVTPSTLTMSGYRQNIPASVTSRARKGANSAATPKARIPKTCGR